MLLIFPGETESELQRVLMERSEVHDALAKAEALNNSLEEEKKKLLDELKNVSIVPSISRYSRYQEIRLLV